MSVFTSNDRCNADPFAVFSWRDVMTAVRAQKPGSVRTSHLCGTLKYTAVCQYIIYSSSPKYYHNCHRCHRIVTAVIAVTTATTITTDHRLSPRFYRCHPLSPLPPLSSLLPL